MFVFQSTYDKLYKECATIDYKLDQTTLELAALRSKYDRLLSKWNELVRKVNDKGGEEFLEDGRIVDSAMAELSQDDIRRLISLCHPDKHGNSTLSTNMTTKLLALRK